MPKLLSRWLFGLFLAFAGLVLIATDLVDALERDVGLASLYRYRGVVEAPSDAVIVAINERSAESLGLPRSLARWPRAVHACVVDKLKKAGASVIVFDLHFTMTSVPNIQYPTASRLPPEVSYCLVKRDNLSNDRAFADAIKSAGNVVLVRRVNGMQHSSIRSVNDPATMKAPRGMLLSMFEEPALAVSAWTLPAESQRIDSFWLTHPATGWTLPVVTLFAHKRDALQEIQFLDKLHLPKKKLFPGLTAIHSLSYLGNSSEEISVDVAMPRSLYRGQIADTETPLDDMTRLQTDGVYPSLAKILKGPDSRLLNYYGPGGTIRTIPYHELLLTQESSRLKELDLEDKVVFIGYSDRGDPGSTDHYDTVFRKRDGEGLSGVEIAATAFSNLLSDNSTSLLKPVVEMVLIGAIGVAYGLLVANLSLLLALSLCTLLAGSYFVCAVSVFSTNAIAMPLLVPLGFQLPMAIAFGIFISYRKARRALGRYIPASFANTWLKKGAASTMNQEVYGTCMITDIAGYTAIAEQLSPLKLRDFLNEYLEQLQSPIYRHDGVVLDVVGDGNSAVWSSKSQDANTRYQACCAALEIQDVIGTFNLRSDSPTFSTRIGLHSGKIVISEIGSSNYHSYAMVGDIVNTASRIETLSKQLGTTLLASEQTIEGLDIETRRIGKFQLAGKQEVLTIHELLGHTVDESMPVHRLRYLFETVVTFCEEGKWKHAEEILVDLIKEYPDDGPARFYLRRCRLALSGSKMSENVAVISMSAK